MKSHGSTTSSPNKLMRLPGYEDARRDCAPGSAGDRRLMREPNVWIQLLAMRTNRAWNVVVFNPVSLP